MRNPPTSTASLGMFGRLLLGLCAWLPMSPAAMAADPAPNFAGKLPMRVGEWRRSAQPVIYDRKTLYDYIDGGAELYLAFGFERAITFAYTAGQDDEIKVDIFDMGSPRGAFGAFAHGRETIATEVGQGSDYGGGLLTFWKHRWFVSVLGYPEFASKRKAVYALGRAIAALIPATGAPPAILGALPRSGLIAASVRTFHHPLLQNDYVTLSHDNPLGIGPDTEAVLARYARPAGRHVLMLVDYPAEAEARRGQGELMKRVLGGEAVGKRGDTWIGVKQQGRRLILVLDAPSKTIAEHVLAEMP